MRKCSRIRRVAKKGGLLACALLLAVWVISIWWHVEYYRWRPEGAGSVHTYVGNRWASLQLHVVVWGPHPDVPNRPRLRESGWRTEEADRKDPWWKRLGLIWPIFHRWNDATFPGGHAFQSTEVYIPFWSLCAVIAVVPTWLWWRDRPFPKGHCQTCGYNLTGNVSGICPECGTPIAGEASTRSRGG
jgi:hypothetical protein